MVTTLPAGLVIVFITALLLSCFSSILSLMPGSDHRYGSISDLRALSASASTCCVTCGFHCWAPLLCTWTTSLYPAPAYFKSPVEHALLVIYHLHIGFIRPCG